MKMIKVVVLLLSIAGGSLIVWNATRDKGEANKNEISSNEMIGSSKSKVTGLDLSGFDPGDMQGSSKSGLAMDSEDIAESVEDESLKIIITDEEVKATRESMMMSSKIGFVMSEEEVRKMLEERVKEKPKAKAQPTQDESSKGTVTDEDVKKMRESMLSTSKSGRIMSDDKIREMLEKLNKEKPHLMHSSKVRIAPIIRQEDLEKFIEGENKDQSNLEKLPPQQK